MFDKLWTFLERRCHRFGCIIRVYHLNFADWSIYGLIFYFIFFFFFRVNLSPWLTLAYSGHYTARHQCVLFSLQVASVQLSLVPLCPALPYVGTLLPVPFPWFRWRSKSTRQNTTSKTSNFSYIYNFIRRSTADNHTQ